MPPGNHPMKVRDAKNRTSASQPRRSRSVRSSTPDSSKSPAASRSRTKMSSTTNTASTLLRARTAADSSIAVEPGTSKAVDRYSKEAERKSRQQRPSTADSTASIVPRSSNVADRRSEEQRKSTHRRHRSHQRPPTPADGKNTRPSKSIDQPSKQSDQQQLATSINSLTAKVTSQPPKIHRSRRRSGQNKSTSSETSRQSGVRSKESHGSREQRSSTPSINHDNRERLSHRGTATDQPSRQSSNALVKSRPQHLQSAESQTPTKSDTGASKTTQSSNFRSSKRHERTTDRSREQSASPHPFANYLPSRRHRQSTEQLVSADRTDFSSPGFSQSGSSFTGTETQSRSKTERFQSTQRSEARSQCRSTTSSSRQQWPRWSQRDLDTIVSVLSDNKQDDPRQKAIRWIDSHRNRLHSHPQAAANLSCALDDVEMDRPLARAALRHLASRKFISEEESRTITTSVSTHITFGDLAQLLRRHATVFKHPHH